MQKKDNNLESAMGRELVEEELTTIYGGLGGGSTQSSLGSMNQGGLGGNTSNAGGFDVQRYIQLAESMGMLGANLGSSLGMLGAGLGGQNGLFGSPTSPTSGLGGTNSGFNGGM